MKKLTLHRVELIFSIDDVADTLKLTDLDLQDIADAGGTITTTPLDGGQFKVIGELLHVTET